MRRFTYRMILAGFLLLGVTYLCAEDSNSPVEPAAKPSTALEGKKHEGPTLHVATVEQIRSDRLKDDGESALLIRAGRNGDESSFCLMLPAGPEGLVPLAGENGTTVDFLLSDDKTACGFGVKLATKNHHCHCAVVSPEGGIRIYRDLNLSAEGQFLADKKFKRVFGGGVDLSDCVIRNVSSKSVALEAHVQSEAEYYDLAFTVKLRKDGSIRLSSWRLGEATNPHVVR